MHPFYSIRPKVMFGSVLHHFSNLRTYKMKTCVSGMNEPFRGTEVVKHPFYSIRPKMMLGSISEHFANLRHVKRCKILMFHAWMQYFDVSNLRCIHSTLSDLKWCFGVFYTILLTFRHIRWKTFVSGLNALFRGTEVSKHPFYYIGPKMMFGSVQSIPLTFGTKKDKILVLRVWLHYFAVSMLRYIHSTMVDPIWCSGVV
jgi:hypothetical protein